MKVWRIAVAIVLVTVLLLKLTAGQALAWSPIAHCIIAEEIGEDPGYSNLPDAWPNREYVRLVQWDCVIVPEFCWSHGVQRAGGVPVPLAPEYADDGRYPEIALHFLSKKWKDYNSSIDPALRGIMVHNASDRHVHWSFFQAAPNGMPLFEGIDTWSVNHGVKELWADYVVFASKKCGMQFDENTGDMADWSLMFDRSIDDHGPVKSNLWFSTAIKCDNNVAKFLRLGQQSFRKTGYSLDKTTDLRLSVETTAAIMGRVSTENEKYGDCVSDLRYRNTIIEAQDSLAVPEALKIYHWAELVELAKRRKWKPSACMGVYQQSVELSRQWINAVEAQ